MAAAEELRFAGDTLVESPDFAVIDGGLRDDFRDEEEIELTAAEELALYATVECVRAYRQTGESAPTQDQMSALCERRDELQRSLSESARAKIVFFAHGPVLTPELA